MCSMHNAIFRGFNCIYQQAPYVVDADKASFVGYCLTWYRVLKYHTENEDSSLFPRTEELLKDNSIWEGMHQEHGMSPVGRLTQGERACSELTTVEDAFQPGLVNFEEYLRTLQSPQDFSGQRLREIMASFQDPFETHFRNEISVIANLSKHPKTPKPHTSEEKNTQAAFDGREGKAFMLAGITDIVPFVLFHMDWAYEDGMWAHFPPIPSPIRWTVISTAKLLHSDWWRFACCDSQGKRKQLHALPPLAQAS